MTTFDAIWLKGLIYHFYLFLIGLVDMEKKVQQKGMTSDLDFYYSFSFSSSIFLGGKRKEKKNKQSRGKKSCLSARSKKIVKS